nr:hypothetical protein Iba_chr15dCG7880 [Ipomoea batatas]
MPSPHLQISRYLNSSPQIEKTTVSVAAVSTPWSHALSPPTAVRCPHPPLRRHSRLRRRSPPSTATTQQMETPSPTGKLAKLKAELREVEDGLVKALAGYMPSDLYNLNSDYGTVLTIMIFLLCFSVEISIFLCRE